MEVPRVVVLAWDDPFIRTTVGGMYLFAAVLGIVSVAVQRSPYANLPAYLTMSTLSIVAGVVILVQRQRAIPLSFERLALAATMMVTASVYFSGDPASPSLYLYLWPTVIVFSFFTRRDVVEHVATVACCSAAAIMALVIRYPELGPLAHHAPRWMTLMGTAAVVGVVARVLTASVGATELRLRRGFEDSPVGIALVSRDLRWLDVNDAVCRMLDRSRDELVGWPTAEVTHPDDVDVSARAIGTVGSQRERAEFENRYLRPDGSSVWAHVRARLVTGARGEQFYFAVMSDITAQRTAEDRLRYQATHDPLTGLPNRAAVLQHLEDVLFESSALGGSVTVMLTDLDDFKVINDSLGHFVGDAALREVAVRMKDSLGPFGMVARLGGDEFVFVGRNVSHMASDLGERLARIVAGPLRLEGMTHHLTASVGIAISTATSTPPDMLRDADIAMYRAKATGKGAVEIFGEHCRADARARLEVEQELRHELESPSGAIEVHYQPIVRLHDLSVCGFEALVRWRRGDELVSPANFVPIAEDTGLIVPLGRYVLADAVTTFTRWIDSRPHASTLRLHVNVSARQVASDSLVRDIDRILSMTPLPHGALTLEVTETALLDDRRAARFCRQLRRLGVRVGLDDFGTGYSALSHLRRLELDVVKIDRSFVSGLAVSARDQAIVESTIALAHAVGLSVVAEGVETQAQLEVLQRIGCDAAQGYLLAPPAPADAMAPFLDNLVMPTGS